MSDPYDKLLEGKAADPMFLCRFIIQTKAWAHVDIHARTPQAKPGREGAEVLAARLLYDLIEARFGARTKARKSARVAEESS